VVAERVSESRETLKASARYCEGTAMAVARRVDEGESGRRVKSEIEERKSDKRSQSLEYNARLTRLAA